MIESNRIIIVDDVEEDLQKLSDVFHKYGIGCKTFRYDGFNFPDTPLKGVRFAFFDIHLAQSPENKTIFSTLKDAISKYISKENGKYVLMFWSNRTELVQDFIEFINRTDDEFKAKLKPITLEILDKNEFINPDSDLETKLNTILSNDIVECLIKFDEAVLLAATQTLDNILSIIPFTDQWGKTDQFSSDCKAVFSKIAEVSYGFTQAKKNPDAAIKEAITPVFESILKQNNNSCWKKFLTPLRDARNSSELKFPMSVSTAKLNSIFHIDNYNIGHRDKTERGALCLIEKDKVDEVFNNIIRMKFLDWFSLTFPGLNKADRKLSKVIAIEISAACDYAQAKKRTNKYVLGAIIPEECISRLNTEKTGEYLFVIPFSFEMEGKNYKIGLNLNYTIVEQDNLLFLDHPILILNKEIMDFIGSKYANHISRLGITCF